MDYGLPQGRTVVTLLASTHYVQPEWFDRAKTDRSRVLNSLTTTPTIHDVIGDLSLENPRKWGDRTGFIYRHTPSKLSTASPITLEGKA